MRLKDKGKIQPPIELPEFPEMVSKAVQNFHQVISATHWDLYDRKKPDGADFYVGEAELGHIHINGEVHLATDLELRKKILKFGLARPFSYTGGVYDGWVEFSIRNSVDAHQAITLFELNFRRLIGRSTEIELFLLHRQLRKFTL
jgi:hypothetical protein